MEFISRIVIIFKYEENPFKELLFLITLIKWIVQEQKKKIFRIFFNFLQKKKSLKKYFLVY